MSDKNIRKCKIAGYYGQEYNVTDYVYCISGNVTLFGKINNGEIRCSIIGLATIDNNVVNVEVKKYMPIRNTLETTLPERFKFKFNGNEDNFDVGNVIIDSVTEALAFIGFEGTGRLHLDDIVNKSQLKENKYKGLV